MHQEIRFVPQFLLRHATEGKDISMLIPYNKPG